MTPPEACNEHIVGYIVASKAASGAGGAGDDGQASHPGEFVASNARDRRSFSVMDIRRDENLMALPDGEC